MSRCPDCKEDWWLIAEAQWFDYFLCRKCGYVKGYADDNFGRLFVNSAGQDDFILSLVKKVKERPLLCMLCGERQPLDLAAAHMGMKHNVYYLNKETEAKLYAV